MISRPVQDWRRRSAKAGASYFILVLAVGWILGPIRTVWATPRFGPMIAILLEAAIMLMAMVVAAKWASRRFDVPSSLAARILMGLVAFGLLIPAEIAGALWLRRLYLASLMNPPGFVALSMFLLFAAVPSLIWRSGNREGRAKQASHRRGDWRLPSGALGRLLLAFAYPAGRAANSALGELVGGPMATNDLMRAMILAGALAATVTFQE